MKTFFIVAIVLVIIAVIGIWLLRIANPPVPEYSINDQQNEEIIADTTDWQTYRNDALGFEFQYPAEWTQDERSVSEVTFGAREPHFIHLGIALHPLLKIPENDVRFSCDEISIGEQVGTRCINEQVTWSQEEVENWKSVGTVPNKIAWIQVEHDEHFYLFNILGSPEREEEFQALDEVLSTFRFRFFTKWSVDTSNWEIYRDNKLGFEVMYPPGLEEECGVQDLTSLIGTYFAIGPLNLTVLDDEGLALEEFVQDNPPPFLWELQDTLGVRVIDASQREATLAGRQTNEITWHIEVDNSELADSPFDSWGRAVYLHKEDEIFRLMYDDGFITKPCDIEPYEDPFELAESILSTFRFVE